MIKIEHLSDRSMIIIRASGTLTINDYEAAIPELQNSIELSDGPLRVLLRLEDFSGWEIGALWREIEFDLKYGKDFGRIAVVGENLLEEWGTTLSAPFTKADMQFFPADQEAKAYEWLRSAPPAPEAK